MISAAIPALLSTPPTWRAVLHTADPAPARSSGSARVAVADNGSQVNAPATPTSVIGSANRHTGWSGSISTASHSNATTSRVNPNTTRGRGCARSTRRPTTGASTTVAIAVGAMSSAARSAVSPATSCRKIINGIANAAKTKLTSAIPALDSTKFRYDPSRDGINGSLECFVCHPKNTAIQVIPVMIVAQIGTDQSWCWPSCTPSTIRQMPAPDNTTPTMSKRSRRPGSAGISHAANARPTTPIGRLIRKIHRQPAVPRSTPPSTGPASIPTPAVAPQTLIAAPWRCGGKVLVIDVRICGVSSAAPMPWTTRAQISVPTEVDRPHHTDAAVNVASPNR